MNGVCEHAQFEQCPFFTRLVVSGEWIRSGCWLGLVHWDYLSTLMLSFIWQERYLACIKLVWH